MARAILRPLAACFSVFLLFFVSAALAAQVNQQQKRADSVQVAVDDIPRYFSPYADTPLDLQYAHLLFDPLVRWGTESQLEMRLVKKWQSIQPGITRFYLKKNIKFHSGNRLSSRDVTWTFAQLLKSLPASLFFKGIKTIKAVDRYRFDVYSSLSQAQLLDYLTHFFVLDSAFYQRNTIEINKKFDLISAEDKKLTVSGTGPYKIKQYNSALHLELVSNKSYWGGEAALKALNFIKIHSATSRSFALLADDVDISGAVSNEMIDTISMVASKSLVEVNVANVVFLTINDKKSAIFKLPMIRDAINLAINKEGMLKHIIRGMGSIGSIYSPLNQADKTLPKYNLSQAQQLLGKIKIPSELTLLILVDQIGNTGEVTNALVNMMKRIGVKLLITEVTDINEWNKQLLDYDFSLSVWYSPLINRRNIYHSLFDDSVLSSYLNALFNDTNMVNSIKNKAIFFEQLQHSQQIIPLLFQNKIWATDNHYNLSAIFSVNGIPYWHLLTKNESSK